MRPAIHRSWSGGEVPYWTSPAAPFRALAGPPRHHSSGLLEPLRAAPGRFLHGPAVLGRLFALRRFIATGVHSTFFMANQAFYKLRLCAACEIIRRTLCSNTVRRVHPPFGNRRPHGALARVALTRRHRRRRRSFNVRSPHHGLVRSRHPACGDSKALQASGSGASGASGAREQLPGVPVQRSLVVALLAGAARVPQTSRLSWRRRSEMSQSFH